MKIAIVGTGIAGLGAAFALHRKHELVVYEQAGWIGGHSNTIDVPGRRPGDSVPVDTGFIVFNERTYPNLLALFAHLRVPYELSNMSFSVSTTDGRLEYSGDGLLSLFAQRRNLLRPGHYAMLLDLLRFYRQAPSLIDLPCSAAMTLGEYLESERFGRAFVEDHLLPMGAAIWSSSIAEMMRFPARSFVRFFDNHGLLLLKDRPLWYTVSGGSREYVARLTAPFRERIRARCPVVAVTRVADGVTVRSADGHAERFDQVVLATHGDQALTLLADADEQERAVLGGFRYHANRAVLHTDPGLMPRRRRAWASWNYRSRRTIDGEPVASVTYWMNRLQNIDEAVPLFVSLNPIGEPADGTVLAEFDYDHPQFDAAAIAAQGKLGAIQGRNGVWFCGSYCGYGFHEDGLASGLAVAEALGCPRPWTVAREMSPAAEAARPRPEPAVALTVGAPRVVAPAAE